MLIAFIITLYIAIGFLAVICERGWKVTTNRSGYVAEPVLTVLLWPLYFIALLFILFDRGTD